MNNYELLKKAYELACIAHKDQKDKAGKDYISHPILVALQCETTQEKIAALLHDAIEDGDGKVSIEMLKEYFSDEIIEAIKQLTHDDKDDYFEYLEKMTSSIALKVKLADLTMNMDVSRISNITQQDLIRTEKYKKAKEIILKKLNSV